MKLEQIVRLVLLLAAYWAILLFPLIFRVYVQIVGDDVSDATEDQVRCSAITGSHCELSERLNYGLWFLHSLDIAGHGCIIFLFMGTSKVHIP
jgi:hypothetical protein